MLVLERHPGNDSPAMQAAAPARASQTLANAGVGDFSARMQLLIQVEGNAASIARRSGFAEDTVRDWCSGRGDISREHCVIIARSLGVSLRWLLAGEGSMRTGDVPVISAAASRATPAPTGDDAWPADNETQITLDPVLLATAFRVLQSYIGLVGGSLNPTQRADAIAQIYHVLGHAGTAGHADRLIALHTLLGGYFCSRKSLIG
ncbi:helix-turn-helix domain-containing protein [Rhodanobacter hydrolyticus]|uniref:Helix-turn-helix transcriptional regulator n=1 Tax=Rhodanobacter hydrolyticus TaxID=2250595 RepID=A0ABW8J897_9GAMM